MDLRTALLQGQKLLEDAEISAPRLTAEVLLAHAIGCERTWLYAHSNEELRELWWIHFGRSLHERLMGKPTQYITGHQEFYGRDFRVTKDVLIPRPETEHVIEAALARSAGASTILDIGTGSGAIAVTIALEAGARVVATDLSMSALRIAAENARKLGGPVEFAGGDLGSAFKSRAFDMVVSNPPYIPMGDTLAREVQEHEPAEALFAGPDGLEIYRRLIPEAGRLLRPAGWLIMELAHDSANRVEEMLEGWREIEFIKDLAGHTRVVAARRP